MDFPMADDRDEDDAPTARQYDRDMSAGGPTNLRKKKKKPKGKPHRGMNVPMHPTPSGPHAQ